MGDFENIKNRNDVNGYGEIFMELKGQELFKYKALQMKRLKVADRWYKKICQCGGDIFEEVDIFITQQGILESMKGHASDFLLFTSEFNFKSGWKATGE